MKNQEEMDILPFFSAYFLFRVFVALPSQQIFLPSPPSLLFLLSASKLTQKDIFCF